jgi:hypothetical protein
MRNAIAEQIEAIDLIVDRRLGLLIESVQELAHRLAAFGIPVVDGSEVAQGGRALWASADTAGSRAR